MPNSLWDMFQPQNAAGEPASLGDAFTSRSNSLIGLGLGLLAPSNPLRGQSSWGQALEGFQGGAQIDARTAAAAAQLKQHRADQARAQANADRAFAFQQKQAEREPEVLRTMRISGIDPASPEGRALLYPKTDEWKAGSVTVREKEYPYRANLRTGQYEWGPLGPPPGIGAPATANPYAGGAAVPFVGGGGAASASGALPPAVSTTGAGGAATTTPSGAIPPPLPGMEDELPSVQKDIRKKQLEDYSKTQLKDPQQTAAAQKSAADVLTAIDTAEKQVINKGGLLPTTGILGGKLTQVYGPSADLSATLNTIAANISLDKLNAMRQASTSGASGLGAVTEPEHRMLMNSIAALEQSQSQDQLLSNLKRVRATYNWVINRTDKNEPPPFSLRPDASQPATTSGGGGAGGTSGVRRYNPQTGGFN